MAFSQIPMEILQQIGLELTSDKDLSAWARTSRNTRNAIYSDGCSFWFRRFRQVYDPRDGSSRTSNTDHLELYKHRHVRLSSKVVVRRGKRTTTTSIGEVNMRILIDMIKDASLSYEDPASGAKTSLNAPLVIEFAVRSGLMAKVFYRTDDTTTKLTVQLVLAHLMLDLNSQTKQPLYDTYSFNKSQQVVYASASSEGVFLDRAKKQVNIPYALHCVNFFKNHLTRYSEQTAYGEYSRLRETDRPQAWHPQAKQDIGKLGRNWIGTYAYLEPNEIHQIRHARNRDDIFFQDKHIDEGANVLQDMEIDFVPEGGEHYYPEAFARILDAQAQGAGSSSRAQHRPGSSSCEAGPRFYFMGTGSDEEQFETTGYVTPLPPQHNIPGFSRVTMIKYFCLDDGQTVAMDSLWAYEGVVLPGGKIMVGRWWAAHEGAQNGEMYSGPFIFWNVPEEEDLMVPATPDGNEDSDDMVCVSGYLPSPTLTPPLQMV